MRKIFVSHPYADCPEKNKKKVNEICRGLITQGYMPISPLHLFSFLDNDNFREQILQICFDLIDLSDEVWVYGESEGCNMELEYALLINKPIKILTGGDYNWEEEQADHKSHYKYTD